MMNRLLAIGLWTGLALRASHAISTQTAVKTEPITVNEVKARAVLAQDSIYLELPSANSASAGERATAWLLSPAGTSSGEMSVVLRVGTRSVSLMLPWPKDERGDAVKEIGCASP